MFEKRIETPYSIIKYPSLSPIGFQRSIALSMILFFDVLVRSFVNATCV